MRLALAQARGASGRTHPNPPVGAVVFRGERVLGRGRTRPAGGAHAEIVAIDRALRRFGPRAVRGASLAVTLEPCSHTGRTGPCTGRIIAAGISRVFVGHRDPHPEVAGRGLRRLRAAGIAVGTGVLEASCREQHRGFLRVLEVGRPFVSLKLAATLDGRIATAGGESRWITGAPARALVHRLRARVDAVWVGSGTALADDPELYARRGDRIVHRPLRIVADSRLRLPVAARVLRGAPGRTWLLCSQVAPAARRRRLEARGAVVIPLPRRGRGLDLRRALAVLAERGITEVLVEGGGVLSASLLREQLVDELHWFAAPRFLGADARPAVGELGISRLALAPSLEDVRIRRIGADLHLCGRVVARARKSR